MSFSHPWIQLSLMQSEKPIEFPLMSFIINANDSVDILAMSVYYESADRISSEDTHSLNNSTYWNSIQFDSHAKCSNIWNMKGIWRTKNEFSWLKLMTHAQERAQNVINIWMTCCNSISSSPFLRRILLLYETIRWLHRLRAVCNWAMGKFRKMIDSTNITSS